MSRHLQDSCVFALIGLFALAGCAAADDGKKEEGAASGAAGSSAAGKSGAASGGVAGATPSFGVTPAGGSATGGNGGTAGLGGAQTGGTSGASSPVAGNAGARDESAGGAGNENPIPNDPRCTAIRPVQGASCDGRGPVLCSSGTQECVCFTFDEREPTWTCVDTDGTPGLSGGEVTLGAGGVGGGRDIETGIGFDAGGSERGGRDPGQNSNGGGSGRELDNPGISFGGGIQSEFNF